MAPDDDGRGTGGCMEGDSGALWAVDGNGKGLQPMDENSEGQGL